MDIKRGLRLSIGWAIGIIISLLPLALWIPTQAPGFYAESPAQLYGALAKASAYVGLLMLSYSVILSARLKWNEWTFAGLDKLYDAHRIFGKVGYGFIVSHAVFLTLKFSTGFGGGLKELWLGEPFGVKAGRLAFYGLTLMLFGSVLIKMKHQTFLKIHRLLGPFFLIGAFHAFAVRAHLDVNPGLRAYMIAVTAFATGAFIYHSVFGKLLVQRFKYVVVAVNKLGQGIFELVLKRSWRPVIFTPGQFAYVTLKDRDVDESEAHPFSFSSSNKDQYLRFVVKNLGDYTSNLGKVDIGTQAYVEGPYGGFSFLNTKNKNQVWIAGGIGITPFLSMARSLRKNARHKIDIYYCTKTPEEAVFTYELKRIAQKHSGIRIISVCEARDGFLTADAIAKHSGELRKKDYLICGPPVMMKSLHQQLRSNGVDDTHIQMEEFSY